jgi:hypothetical protein
MRLLSAYWNFLRLFHLANGSCFFGGVMLKLKEAASEFGVKGSANILARTEPLGGASFYCSGC